MLLMDEFGVDVDPEVTCDDDVGNCNKGRVRKLNFCVELRVW